MTLKIARTRLLHYDATGGAVIALETSRRTYSTHVRAITQSDGDVLFGRVPHPTLPSPVAIHVARFTDRLAGFVKKSPSRAAALMDARLLRRAKSLDPTGLRILAGSMPADDRWPLKLDKNWLLAGAESSADIIALPPVEGEDAPLTMARLEIAEQMLSGLPGDFRDKTPAIVVRLDDAEFATIVTRLFDAGVKVFGIEFHGGGGVANLALLHRQFKAAQSPPYVFAVNAPRTLRGDRGSLAIAATAMGVQVTAARVATSFAGNADVAPPEIDWFVHGLGGYVAYSDIRPTHLAGCGCPDAPHHSTGDTLREASPARRRHETFALAAEANAITAAIAAGKFAETYAARRPLLQPTLSRISSE